MANEKLKDTRQRDYAFDNLKAVLILLVVFGHLLVQGKQYAVCNVIYRCIYVFHMPLFVFISGYFSKKAAKSFSYAVKSALIPYILFALIFKIVDCAITPAHLSALPRYLKEVPFVHWYLLCLFYWRFITPLLAKIKFPILPILFALGIASGLFLETNTLSVARAITFLPYYWLGFSLSSERVETLRSRSKLLQLGILAVIFAAAIYCFINVKLSYADIFQMKESYAGCRLEPLSGVLVRTLTYAAASVICLCLVGVTPNRRTILSSVGNNTLSVYIWHSYVIYFAVRKFGILDGIISRLNAAGTVAFLFGCAVVLTVVLCLPPFTTLANGINKLAASIFGLLEKPFKKAGSKA